VWQGFTTRKKVWYAKDVLHMLGEYVKVQRLEPYLRLNTDVVAHQWSDEHDRWILTVSTAGGPHTQGPAARDGRTHKRGKGPPKSVSSSECPPVCV
jgi:hypothetical protein